MNLILLLQSFGLTDSESKVYIAGLRRDHLSVSELAELSGIKRTAVYHVIETLQEKGFMKLVRHGAKHRYRSEQPEQLQKIVEKKEADIKKLKKRLTKAIPLFPSVSDMTFGLPHIEVFRGRGGLKNLGEKIFMSKKKEVYNISPSFEILDSFEQNDEVLEYLQERAKRGIRTKSIWTDLPKKKRYYKHKKLLRETRLAPKKIITENKTKIDIFDNSVLIINLLPELTGLLIESVDYTKIMKSLWQVLWDVSRPVD
jgi:sugar-specific transcriptional regulator TrmB